jgi:1-deoxy-D-xylulose-5-phosphate reductoisomerase
MQRIAILGSTGSIGISALEVVRHFPDKFRVIALSADSNIEILYRQIKEVKPLFVCIRNDEFARKLKSKLDSKPKVFVGEKGLQELLERREIEKILLAISGSAALMPLLQAIDNGKEIALANKEALVMAGDIIMARAAKKKINIIPIDSEQSAIWQCLEAQDKSKIKYVYLTASGGPFRETDNKALKNMPIKKVLKHPRWKMGRKISVDSANLMNKGLELLEAMFLFNLPCHKIKIVIHPQAIIHSMVEFTDGVVLAQLSATDMRIPIQYALSYPFRLSNSFPGLDFYKLKRLEFFAPDFHKFPCLRLAYRAASELGTTPAVLNSANEVCVSEFLRQNIPFTSIPKIIETVINRHKNTLKPSLDEIMAADSWARQEAYRVIKRLN